MKGCITINSGETNTWIVHVSLCLLSINFRNISTKTDMNNWNFFKKWNKLDTITLQKWGGDRYVESS